MRIKDQIRSRREQLGMTIEDVARKMGVTLQAVRWWENGRSEPGRRNRHKLEKFFGITLDWTDEIRHKAREYEQRKIAELQPNAQKKAEPEQLSIPLPEPVAATPTEPVGVGKMVIDPNDLALMFMFSKLERREKTLIENMVRLHLDALYQRRSVAQALREQKEQKHTAERRQTVKNSRRATVVRA